MGIIHLTQQNFEKQIVQYGFFAEQIPACFSSKQLADKLSIILPLIDCDYKQVKKAKNNTTVPTVISTYKNNISRRILSLPNPAAFLRTVKLYSENWARINSLANSSNSLSSITYLRSYSKDNFLEEINSENLREVRKAKSDFVEGVKSCIRIALGYQYRLKVDIANCYNSIYTHSVTWAICGKENAKTYMRTKKPLSLRENYELGDAIDAFTRFQKNNETNGIVVGPYTSRIFSEIVLSAVDKLLNNKGFVFKRYVDDYKFYFRSEAQAKESVRIIEKILNQYNLHLNLAKTEILRFPYEKLSNMQSAYAAALKKDGIFGVLNAAAQFHTDGEKGAYKYALKYIRKQKLDLQSFELIFPLLVNIMLLDPKYGKYVITFLKKNRTGIDIQKLSNIANNELMQSLKGELQQESLLFLYLIHDIRLKISPENIIAALNSQDDFSIIIALDIWQHHNSLVIRTKTQARIINKAINTLAAELSGENYLGSRWLLLYEAEKHDLFPKGTYTPIARTPLFEALFNNGISFYEGK